MYKININDVIVSVPTTLNTRWTVLTTYVTKTISIITTSTVTAAVCGVVEGGVTGTNSDFFNLYFLISSGIIGLLVNLGKENYYAGVDPATLSIKAIFVIIFL